MDLDAALRYLDEHVNLEAVVADRHSHPTLERMQRLMHVLGDPQHTAPLMHITGTNGKGSTAQIATRLLEAHGLSVGTYTSPHLQKINERIAVNGFPIDDDELAEAIRGVADAEALAGVEPSYFEILTAAAYRWFADVAVDVVVAEVGLLGRWDATNIGDGQVAVVTNVELDHTEYAGPTRLDIAREKAGIVKPGASLVLGETDPELVPVFLAEGPGETFMRDLDFGVNDNVLAVGGRLLELRTPGASYTDLYLPLHGAHQGDNAVAALTAVEAFFGGPLSPEIVAAGFENVVMPGRFEIVGRHPLVVLDGAHNPAGADVAAAVVDDEFSDVDERIYVIGMLRGRDPIAMLEALDAQSARLVIATAPATARAVPAIEIARAATTLEIDVVVVDGVGAAVQRALDEALADDLVLVTGSLYVVGEARGRFVA
ncbi:MAG TPA: cyanophycin synthetase [Acidimicrobiales bacterium]|nr:cyanophycin synthetase [Acidimicrobiales bacterium]